MMSGRIASHTLRLFEPIFAAVVVIFRHLFGEVMMAKTEAPRLAVLGAGPIGLEAALYARKLDLSVTIFERSRIGEYLHRWGHVRLFSPFGMNTTALGRAAIRAEFARHELPSEGDCITG